MSREKKVEDANSDLVPLPVNPFGLTLGFSSDFPYNIPLGPLATPASDDLLIRFVALVHLRKPIEKWTKNDWQLAARYLEQAILNLSLDVGKQARLLQEVPKRNPRGRPKKKQPMPSSLSDLIGLLLPPELGPIEKPPRKVGRPSKSLKEKQDRAWMIVAKVELARKLLREKNKNKKVTDREAFAHLAFLLNKHGIDRRRIITLEKLIRSRYYRAKSTLKKYGINTVIF